MLRLAATIEEITMSRSGWPSPPRRHFLAAALGSAASLALPGRLTQAAAPTPRQGEGPFYPTALPSDIDSDLVRVTGADAAALGQVTHVTGRVLDRQGRPLPGLLIEIWQCDANGRYLHQGDRRGQRDPGFQGFGRALADASGGYRFRTIRPVAYPGRTPHIHFKVLRASDELLTTQMYVAGEVLNERDGLYRRLDSDERERLTVTLRPAPELEGGALSGIFDIVIAS
jgi:protocatechuate 3,4-dioxygenase beta subunit